MIGGPRKRTEQNLAYSPRVASGEREEVKRKSEKGKSVDGLIPIDKRTKQFAIRIVKLYQYLVEERHEKVLSKQVLRSGTSIGANVAEGLFGASRADFINKYTIALKEANETRYWLELLAETDYLPTCDQTASLLDECKSLIAILAASVKTAKGEK